MCSKKVFSKIIFLIIIILIGALPHAYSQGNSNCNLVTCGDQTIIRGQSVQLSVSGATTYRWTPATGLSDPNSATPMAYPSNTTTYTVTGYNYSDENLVVNGDFEQGNTGFSSGYSYNNNLWDEGTYYIDTDASAHHSDFVGHGHTTGSDKFMMVNGAVEQNKVVWEETINVVSNTQYCFSTWVSTLSSAGTSFGFRANLQFAINGIQIGNNFQSPSSLNVWENFYVLWDSGNATQAVITIVSTSYTNNSGNDFGLDDITFYGVVECPNTEQVTVNVENQSGQVNVTANPQAICVGESSHLHAEAVTTSIVDFETGDFSQANFINTGSNYPWVITQVHPYEGFYCMKSNCEGQHNKSSSIEVSVDVPYDAIMSFFVRVSSEANYDKFHFYIDGIEQGQPLSGQINYVIKRINVSQGSHTYKWEYKKDTSDPTYSDIGDDCVYVDNIVLYSEASSLGNEVYDFDNYSFQGWTTIDADGDGRSWIMGSNEYSYSIGHNNTVGFVASQSYVSGYPLHPDNYLVSPVRTLGGFMVFYACAYTTSYPNEHFGVFVSTNSNTNPSSFTKIQEWTLTAKNNSNASATREQGNWYEYVVDLSAYAGQTGYVAIRHFDCYNQWALFVDDIVFGEEPLNPISDDNVTYHWTPGNMTGPDITVSPTETTTYTVTATDENGTVIGTASQTVVVEPVPVVSITTSTGETAICEEDTITLYASVSGTDFYLPGDILCTDGSIVHPSDWPCGKTAKAIVFYVDATGQHGWAIDLQDVPYDLQDDPNEPIYNMPWSNNSNSNVSVPGLTLFGTFIEAVSDLDGYSNTQKIRSFSNNDPSKYPAAWAVDFDQGWYLPAIGQLNILFGVYFAVKIGLETVGGSTIYEGDLWSSSANTSANAWMIRINNGYVWTEPKTGLNKVRAVINF